MKKAILISIVVIVFATGCESLRLPASESQKQNAFVHVRTAQLAADEAINESASEKLQGLAALSFQQSRAFLADTGLPDELPQAADIDEILADSSFALAQQAALDAGRRLDPWDAADGLLEAALAIAGIIGGAWGLKAAGAVRILRQKSQALREVVEGNEIFQHIHAGYKDAFRASHKQTQSSQTRKIVSQIKNEK